MVPIIDPYLTAYYGASKCQVNNMNMCFVWNEPKKSCSGTCNLIVEKKLHSSIPISFLPLPLLLYPPKMTVVNLTGFIH